MVDFFFRYGVQDFLVHVCNCRWGEHTGRSKEGEGCEWPSNSIVFVFVFMSVFAFILASVLISVFAFIRMSKEY